MTVQSVNKMSRKLNNLAAFLLIAFLGFGLVGESFAQEGTAKAINEMLQNRDKEIKTLIGSKKKLSGAEQEKLRTLVNDVISFEAMGEAVLGKYWSKIDAKQQGEFVDVFGKIVRAQSLADLDPYRAKISYGDVIVDKTKGVLNGVNTEIEYDLVKIGNDWKVKDISLDKVSTVKGYSRSFRSVIRKKGFDKLMTSLNKKLAKIS